MFPAAILRTMGPSPSGMADEVVGTDGSVGGTSTVGPGTDEKPESAPPPQAESATQAIAAIALATVLAAFFCFWPVFTIVSSIFIVCLPYRVNRNSCTGARSPYFVARTRQKILGRDPASTAIASEPIS